MIHVLTQLDVHTIKHTRGEIGLREFLPKLKTYYLGKCNGFQDEKSINYF